MFVLILGPSLGGISCQGGAHSARLILLPIQSIAKAGATKAEENNYPERRAHHNVGGTISDQFGPSWKVSWVSKCAVSLRIYNVFLLLEGLLG